MPAKLTITGINEVRHDEDDRRVQEGYVDCHVKFDNGSYADLSVPYVLPDSSVRADGSPRDRLPGNDVDVDTRLSSEGWECIGDFDTGGKTEEEFIELVGDTLDGFKKELMDAARQYIEEETQKYKEEQRDQ